METSFDSMLIPLPSPAQLDCCFAQYQLRHGLIATNPQKALDTTGTFQPQIRGVAGYLGRARRAMQQHSE
jgi:hypothetical protein